MAGGKLLRSERVGIVAVLAVAVVALLCTMWRRASEPELPVPVNVDSIAERAVDTTRVYTADSLPRHRLPKKAAKKKVSKPKPKPRDRSLSPNEEAEL